jgi:excinuclease UvrABC nuclease subunit
MPITGSWRSLRTESAPEAPGVYELGDFNGSVLYVGSSGNLKRSIARHANGQEAGRAGDAMWFRYEQTAAFDTRVRDLLWQYERANGRPPPRNTEDAPA